MDENQIKQFVEGIKQGNQQAFEALYQLSSKSVYFICLSFLGNEEDAKDVMQDTYITAYREIYSLNDTAKFVPWVNQIAVNKCRNVVIKKTPVIMDIDSMDNQQLEENENFLPEEYISQKEKRKLVMDIMRERLSDIQYQTVILYYFNSLTVDEVADIMECPPGTVKYRLSVARGKIKEGVLQYEKNTNEKLYSMSTIPFLASLLVTEVGAIDAPYVFPEIIAALTGGAVAGATAVASAGVGTAVGDSVIATAGASQAGGAVAKAAVGTAVKTGLGAIKAKIAIGLAATAIVGAGAAAIIIHNNSEDKKEPTNYERFEEMNYVALVDYFKEEYGFVEDMTFEARDEEAQETIYFLVKEKTNERLRLQIEVPFGSDMPSVIVVCRYAQNFNEDYDEWVDVSSFACASDEEREKLKDFMINHSDEEKVIGEYNYKAMLGGGYASNGESARYLVVYLNWNE